MASRIFSRLAGCSIGQLRHVGISRPQLLPDLRNHSKSLLESSEALDEWVPFQAAQLHYLFRGRTRLQGDRFASSASPQASYKELNQSSEKGRVEESDKIPENMPQDTEEDLSVDDLVKLVAGKEELLKAKEKEVEIMKDQALRSYAEMENVRERTKRESENSKKFAIQSFAKSLLDVADNLVRASSVGTESLSKVDESKDFAEAGRRLKELLEGVEMTQKQLTEVFKKFGIEKYDPVNEEFDPNKHYAVVQVPDASKSPGTIAAVLKAGYMLHDRIIRPAEVVVVSQP